MFESHQFNIPIQTLPLHAVKTGPELGSSKQVPKAATASSDRPLCERLKQSPERRGLSHDPARFLRPELGPPGWLHMHVYSEVSDDLEQIFKS